MKFIRDIISEKSKSLGLAETGLTRFDPLDPEIGHGHDFGHDEGDLIEPLNEGQIPAAGGADEYVFASKSVDSIEQDDNPVDAADDDLTSEVAEVAIPETGNVFDEPETDEDHYDFFGSATPEDGIECANEDQVEDETEYEIESEDDIEDEDDIEEAYEDEAQDLEADESEPSGDDLDRLRSFREDSADFEAPEDDIAEMDDFAPEPDEPEDIEMAESVTENESEAETDDLSTELEPDTNEFVIRELESDLPRKVPSPFQRVMKKHEEMSVDEKPEVTVAKEPAPEAAAVAEAPALTPEAIVVPSPAVGRSGRQAGRVKTRLLGFGAEDSVADPFAASENATPEGQSMFPVGWLVVVAGPGLGNSFSLSGGVSQIGRGEDQSVRLDFGDSSISRANHAAVAYDQEQRKFFLGHGGKANLVRLNNRPVLSTEELENGNLIRIGETTLKFVGLCGSDFDWDKGQGNEFGNASFG